MGTVFVLWLFTSSYAMKIEWYVTPQECGLARLTMLAEFARPPRAFLAKMACIETYAPIKTKHQAPSY